MKPPADRWKQSVAVALSECGKLSGGALLLLPSVKSVHTLGASVKSEHLLVVPVASQIRTFAGGAGG